MPYFQFNVMAIRDQHHATSLNKQRYWMELTLVCPNSILNRSVHEGMNDTSNAKVHLRTHGGNVNIVFY